MSKLHFLILFLTVITVLRWSAFVRSTVVCHTVFPLFTMFYQIIFYQRTKYEVSLKYLLSSYEKMRRFPKLDK